MRSQYLAGVGIARQRQAIINGLKDSVVSFSSEIPGTTPQEVMDMMMLTQVRQRQPLNRRSVILSFRRRRARNATKPNPQSAQPPGPVLTPTGLDGDAVQRHAQGRRLTRAV